MSQFPEKYQNKIEVLHDGIDTEYFTPQTHDGLVFPELKKNLSEIKEIVTYVSRGLEPYRGFPQFMEDASLILQKRKKCHIVVVGEDRVAYGKPLPDGKTYKQAMLERHDFDMSRLRMSI